MWQIYWWNLKLRDFILCEIFLLLLLILKSICYDCLILSKDRLKLIDRLRSPNLNILLSRLREIIREKEFLVFWFTFWIMNWCPLSLLFWTVNLVSYFLNLIVSNLFPLFKLLSVKLTLIDWSLTIFHFFRRPWAFNIFKLHCILSKLFLDIWILRRHWLKLY